MKKQKTSICKLKSSCDTVKKGAQIMTKERENELRQSLMEEEKEHIIELFIRLKKMYEHQAEILEDRENELSKYESLEDLIESIEE